MPKPLAPSAQAIVPTIGVREAEDIPTAIAFSKFASGASSLSDLERVLGARVAAFLGATDEEEAAA